MPNALRIAAIAAVALAFAGCAGHRPREEPHHYSKDRYGDRIACYATDVVNEYECVPTVRSRYAYDPFYDPWWPRWSVGLFYGPPRYYGYAYYPWYAPHDHHRRHR
jgi:hypothetical protein